MKLCLQTPLLAVLLTTLSQGIAAPRLLEISLASNGTASKSCELKEVDIGSHSGSYAKIGRGTGSSVSKKCSVSFSRQDYDRIFSACTMSSHSEVGVFHRSHCNFRDGKGQNVAFEAAFTVPQSSGQALWCRFSCEMN